MIEKLKSQGKAILYITHRMDEVFHLADRMVVLRDGRYVTEFLRGARADLEPRIISAMVGRELSDIYPKKNTVGTQEGLRVENLSLMKLATQKNRLTEVSFSVREGEILGLGGLLGSGRTEIFESVFGAYHSTGPLGFRKHRTTCKIWIRGKEVSIETPADAIREGIAWVTEDRKGNGLVLNQSIRNNMNLAALFKGVNPWLHPAAESERTQHWAKTLLLKHQNIDQPVSELSGGNQQKVVLAKWMMLEPKVLFLDEPTRGVDVGAKAEIYEWIHKMASRGIAVVLAEPSQPSIMTV